MYTFGNVFAVCKKNDVPRLMYITSQYEFVLVPPVQPFFVRPTFDDIESAPAWGGLVLGNAWLVFSKKTIHTCTIQYVHLVFFQKAHRAFWKHMFFGPDRNCAAVLATSHVITRPKTSKRQLKIQMLSIFAVSTKDCIPQEKVGAQNVVWIFH